MFMSFRLFVLTMLASAPIVVVSQSPVPQADIRGLVDDWCAGDTATINATYGSIEDWDVSQVTDMSDLFEDETSCNPDISKWNVSGVLTMHSMFKDAEAFNKPIGDWDVSLVEDMSFMFKYAEAFDQPLDDWDVSRVKAMEAMFDEAEVFNQPIGSWDVGRVEIFDDMFEQAEKFNQPIGGWNVSSAVSLKDLFEKAKSFNQPIGNWDVSRVTDMREMFMDAKAFNQPIGNWDVGLVEDMRGMFEDAEAFNQPIGNWDVTSVTKMADMFKDNKVFNQPIGNWDVSRVEDMRRMFEDAEAFNQPIGNWDVTSVTMMEEMFKDTEVFNQPIGNWDVSRVENMKEMFQRASSFDQFIGNWNVSSITAIHDMFVGTGYDRLLCWDSPNSVILNADVGLACSYTEWNTCCDEIVFKESFRVTTCTTNTSTCVEPIRICRATTRFLSEPVSNEVVTNEVSNEVVTNEVSSERTGNLRSRVLNGWFECGSTHCPKERSTCETNEVTNEQYCKCMDGYEEGIECRPTDECETMFPCPGGSYCVDMFPPLKYKCVCNSGYTPVLPNATSFDEPGVPIEYRPIQCLDQDECGGAVTPCHANATCTNTIGGHECKCDGGLLGNGITSCEEPAPIVAVTEQPPSGDCITSDDCTGANMECDEDSECVCFPGYTQVGPNCQNEVHCDEGGFNNDCHRRATCTETDGFPGFACKCIEGWEDAFEGANGKSCKDILPPATEAPPEPITDAPEAEGVGPHPNRPTVFCRDDGATCNGNGACCSGYCF